MIHYTNHKKINKKKWDDTIKSSQYGNTYAMSWYLDITSPNWDALIQGDYEIIMPITHKKKWGFKYVRQPYFSQQLGLFSAQVITEATTNAFLEKLARKFKFIEINLNAGNTIANQKVARFLKSCQYLKMNKPYDQLFENYRRNHKRNINFARSEKLKVERELDGDVFVSHLKSCNAFYLNKDMHKIAEKLSKVLREVSNSKIYGVYSLSNKLLSTGLFVENNNKYYFTLSSTTKEGEESKAMFLLVDEFIKEQAGQDIILDFAGSSMPGVQHFNLGFGSEDYEYPVIKINKFPKTFQIFKTWKV